MDIYHLKRRTCLKFYLTFFFFFSCMCQGKPWPISWINSCITTRRYGGYAALSSHQGTLPLHVLLHELSIFFYFPQHVCCFFGFPFFSSRLRFSFSYLCCLFVCTQETATVPCTSLSRGDQHAASETLSSPLEHTCLSFGFLSNKIETQISYTDILLHTCVF